jgi:MFS family permease
MHPGWIGAILGGGIGLAGGLFGTWASIHHARSAQERRLIIKLATLFWTVGLLFIAGLLLLPSPWRYLLWIPYSILFPLGLIYGNRALQKAAQETTASQSEPEGQAQAKRDLTPHPEHVPAQKPMREPNASPTHCNPSAHSD